MALIKLTLAPDQAGYAVKEGLEVLSTQLDGGAGRYRRDIVGANATINVQWRVNPIEFRYLKSFYNLLTGKGVGAFLLDLYLDREELTEHECHFIPGSFRLSGQRGKQFTVSAQIEAKPIKLAEADEETERIWATLYGELGEPYETLFPPLEADIDQIITFDIPEDLYNVYPPSLDNLTQWLIDNDGTKAIDTLDPQVLTDTIITNVACLEFASGDYVQTPVVLNFGDSDYFASVTFKTTSSGVLLDGRDGNDDGFRMQIAGSNLYVSHNTHDQAIPGLVDGEWHTVAITKTGTQFSIVVDAGVPIIKTGVIGAVAVTTEARIGQNAAIASENFVGTIASVSVAGYFDYHFPESSGTSCIDVSGEENNGQINTTDLAAMRTRADGIPDWFAEYGGGICSTFDGIDDYLDCGAPLLGTGDFAIAFRMKADTLVSDFPVIGQYVTADAGRFVLDKRADGSMQFKIGGDSVYSSPSFYEAGKFVHVLVSYKKSSSTVSFYANGVFDSSVVQVFADVLQTANTEIGRIAYPFYSNVCMSDIQIFSKALGAAEVALVYARTFISPSMLINLVPSRVGDGMADTLTGTEYGNQGAGSLEIGFNPALPDGSGTTPDGATITHHPGHVHNGGGHSVAQTDAGYIGDIQIMDYSAALAHVTWVGNLLLRFKCIRGIYHVVGAAKYNTSYAPTPAEQEEGVNWVNKYCEPPGGE